MKLFYKLIPLMFFACATAQADQFSEFPSKISKSSIKPFTKDIGSLMGSGLFSTGRSLGFSGFDISARVAGQFSNSDGNNINKEPLWTTWLQGEIGMPFRIDGFIRATSIQGYTIAGGGFRWGITDINDQDYAVQSMLIVAAHSSTHENFSATHFGIGAVVSWKLPVFFLPYIGAGLDRTHLTVTYADDINMKGSDQTTTEYRATLGASIRFAQFGYVNIAGNVMHNEFGAEAGLGLRF